MNLSKSTLRKKSRRIIVEDARRKNFLECKNKTREIVNSLWKSSLTILTYTSLSHEPDLEPLYERLQKTYDVTFIIATKELQDPWILIDLAFVPGLLFDESWVRLGQWGGWYDRFFAAHSETYKVWVCYKEQLVEQWKIPVDDWDVLMNELIVL